MDTRKQEILNELALARSAIRSEYAGLRRELDVPAKVRRAFRAHPLPWMGAATVGGLLVAAAARNVVAGPRKTSVSAYAPLAHKESRGWFWLLPLLKVAVPVLKPVAVALAAKAAAGFARRH